MYEEQDHPLKIKETFSHWASQMQPVGRSNNKITVRYNFQNQANEQDILNTGILSALLDLRIVGM